MPSRAFMATVQSTILFFNTCWAELPSSLFQVQPQHKEKSSCHPNTPGHSLEFICHKSSCNLKKNNNIFHSSFKMNSKLSLPSFPSFACKEGALSSQQTTALVFSAVFKSIACTGAVVSVGRWPAMWYARATQAHPQQASVRDH